MAKWMNAESYVAHLHDCSQIDANEYFGLTEGSNLSEQFYAEVAYLNHWNQSSNSAPNLEGINVGFCKNRNLFNVNFTCDDRSVAGISIDYILINPNSTTKRYSVRIYQGETLLYNRAPSQNPKTEWSQNQLASDGARDEDGELYFGS